MSNEPTPVNSSGGLKEKAQKAQKEFCKKIVSPQFILVSGLIVSGAFIVEGLLCFTICVFNIRSYILSFYYIIFGLMSISAELQIRRILKYFRIIESYSGKGMWYIFLGTIALGSEWWAILIGLVLISEGLLNLAGGCNLPPRTIESKSNSEEQQQLANINNKLNNEVVLGVPKDLVTNSVINNNISDNINDKQIEIQLSNTKQLQQQETQQPGSGNQNNNKLTNPFSAYEEY